MCYLNNKAPKQFSLIQSSNPCNMPCIFGSGPAKEEELIVGEEVLSEKEKLVTEEKEAVSDEEKKEASPDVQEALFVGKERILEMEILGVWHVGIYSSCFNSHASV